MVQSTNIASAGRLRTVLICFSIACNALSAGGVYSFPLISPALVEHMKFTQSQITTIALTGMVGQYPFAAVVGKVLDRFGARTCSLIAAALFGIGFGLFSSEIAQTPDELPAPSVLSFWKLAVYFGLVGLASVFSYFSAVFSATQTFPTYMGIASGTSMALFGCSPLVITALGSKFFTYPHSTGSLNVTEFLAFLAILTTTIHLLSAFFLPGPRKTPETDETAATDHRCEPQTGNTQISNEQSPSEEQPLLSHSHGRIKPYIHAVAVQEPQHGSASQLLQDRNFWVLLLVILVVVGQCEMVMTNLGSIYLSLPPSPSSTATIATQVQLLSISNTATRLLIGPVADLVSPVAAYLHDGKWSFPRRPYISRIVFLVGAALLLVLTFIYTEGGVNSRDDVGLLSIGVGVAYGTTFTVLPGILSSIWGHPNLGRNFGIVSYAPFLGTSIFSYLYAMIAEQHTSEDMAVCYGKQCWDVTFAIGIATLILAAGWASLLWRVWRGRV